MFHCGLSRGVPKFGKHPVPEANANFQILAVRLQIRQMSGMQLPKSEFPAELKDQMKAIMMRHAIISMHASTAVGFELSEHGENPEDLHFALCLIM